MSTVSTLFRKQTLLDSGVDDMFEISDVCLYLNALLGGDAYILNEPVTVYRFHEKNLTYSLPFRFMFNVVREKERIYRRGWKSLPRHKEFWFNHFKITYLFYADGNAIVQGKLKFLFWGLVHSHGNAKLVKFITKQLARMVV